MLTTIPPIAPAVCDTSASPVWHNFAVPVFGGRESHIETGEPYPTMRLADLFAMSPVALPKIDAQAFIPSTYREHDARVHAVQRENGEYVALTADNDEGDHSLQAVESAIRDFTGDAAWSIHSSASNRPGDRRWRALIPLASPVDFLTWHIAQTLFHDHLAAAGIKPDRSLARAGQIVYAPNVPPIHEKSGTHLRKGGAVVGDPLYFERAQSSLDAEGFNLLDGWFTLDIMAAKEAYEAEEARRRAAGDDAKRKRAERAGSGFTTIERFNAANDLTDLLVKYGYEDSPSNGTDWRSPHQTTGSYATQVNTDETGREFWISLSGSDREAGIGRECHSGCHGDAFDLFAHYEHGGDHDAALTAFRTMETLSDFADIDFSAFDEPEAARTTSICASPYLWRDPHTLPLRPWLFGRWLLGSTLAAMVAPGGAGKSTWLASLALSLVSGRPLLGKQVWGGPKRVWLWNLEDDLDEMARAVQAAALHHGISEADVEGRLFVDSGMEGAGLCTALDGPDGFKLLVPVYEALTAELIRRGIDVLVIDPFVSSHQAEENHNNKIDAIAKAWARVAKAANCTILLVHHTSKAGAAEVTALSSRGAVALINAARSTLVINRMTSEVAAKLGIADDERHRYINVTDDKHNRAPAEKADWFQLVGVDLGNGGLAPADNVAAVTPWKLPDPSAGVTDDNLAAVQRGISEGAWRAHPTAAQWAGRVVADVLGLDVENPSDKARIKSLLRKWISNGALRVVTRRDPNKREDKQFIEVGRRLDVAPPA